MGGRVTKKQLKDNQKNQGNKELIGCPDFDNLYKIISDSITGGVWVAKHNDIICYVNKGMSRIAGVPIKSFHGMNVLKDFSEETLKFFRPYYQKAKKTKQKVKYEAIPVITPNKRLSYQSGWLIPVVKNKKIEGIICTVDDVTKEETYKKELETSRKTYQHFFDNIPGGAVVYEAINKGGDFIVGDINNIGERMVQVVRKNILGKRADNVFPGIKKMGLYDVLRRVYKTGKYEFCPAAFYKGKKISKFFENYVYKLPSGDVVAVFWDKTEEIAIKRELEKNEEKFRSLYEGSQDAIMTLSPPSWNFTSANKSAVKMFKVKNEQDFITRAPWGYSPKKQPDGSLSSMKAKEEIQKAMEKGISNFRWAHRRLNGEDFFATVSLTKIKLENKYLLQVIIRDITKEVKQEEEIKKQNNLLNKVINSFPYPFYVIDSNTYEIKTANNAGGSGMPSVINKKCFEVSHRRKRPCRGHHPCPLEIIKETKKSKIVEHIHFDKKGEKRSVEVHGYPVFDEKGEVAEVIEYSIDITDKKQKEGELKKHLKDLEKVNSLMINRELKMIELKEEIKKLKKIK